MKQIYMDYADDFCQTTFTSDQTDIMLATLSTIRHGLVKVQNVNAAKMTCCVLAPRFDGSNFLCKNDSTLFTSLEYTSATFQWSLYKNGVLKWQKSSTSNTKYIVPPDTGFYTVKLKITSGSSTDSIEISKYLEVLNCTGIVKSERGSWYFGDHSGMKFTSNGPVRDFNPFLSNFPFNINTFGGSFSQSSKSGRLLFYGGGEGYEPKDSFKVFNKNYSEMKYKNHIYPRGSLNGGQCIAIPFRKDTMRFHLFTIVESDPSGTTGGYYHSTVRADKDSVYADTTDYLKESGTKIHPHSIGAYAAIPRCDDKSYWLLCIQHMPINQDSAWLQKFIIDSMEVITYYGKQKILLANFETSIGVSPDGSMVALNYGIYSFDKKNAKLSNLYNFPKETNIAEGSLGISFSPNGNLVYYTRIVEDQITNKNHQELFQINPFSTTGEKFVIEKSNKVYQFGHIKQGPDNNLYIAAPFMDFISRIKNPDQQFGITGSTVQYSKEAVMLSANGQGGYSMLGLPNYSEAKKKKDIALDFKTQFVSCDGLKLFPAECCANAYLWKFGNGDTSHRQYPYYIYPDTGTFVIKLIVGNDSIAKTFKIGNTVPAPALQGDSLICDFNKFHEYSTPISDNFTYTWEIFKPSYEVYTGNKIYVQWPGSGIRAVRLTAQNSKTGCLNSTSVYIYNGTIPSNNIIPADFIVCDSNSTHSITGSTPTGVTPGSYSFQWHYRTSDSTWKQIDTATHKDFIPGKVPIITQLMREVNQNGCINFSNRLTLISLKKTNTIQLSVNPCFKKSAFSISGNATYGSLYGYINWQYSTDQSTWNYYGIHSQYLDTILHNDSVYIRRLINYTGYCEVASNVIKIVPYVAISKQPSRYFTCSWQGAQFSMDVKNKSNMPLKYYVSWYDSASHTWSPFGPTSNLNKHIISSIARYSSRDSIQMAIVAPCGTLYSNKVLLQIRSSGPRIDTDPSDQSINEGTRTSLLGVVFNPYEAGLSYGWQYRIDLRTYNSIPYSWAYKAPAWYYVNDSVRNKLNFIAGICDDSVEYRFVANNGCNSFSDPARMYVTHKSDLWMKDSQAKDTGAEPNRGVAPKSNPSQRTMDIFKSPDLFNCSNFSNCSSPEAAEFKNYSDNFVRFKIRNKGSIPSTPARLYLYWTLASTGEVWDKSWKHKSDVAWKTPTSCCYTYPHYSRFFNLDSGKYFPTGGEINSIGIIIPSVVSSGTFESFYAWRPPNWRWFYREWNGKKTYDTTLQICLLARIEYCDEYPHKMHTAELYRTSIDTNVINNNNIVTHNLWLRDDKRLNKRSYPYRPVWTQITQPREDPSAINLHFDARNLIYYNTGLVIATFDDALWAAWVNGGSLGSGFLILDSQRVRITSVNAVFNNIYSDSLLIGNLGFEFFPIDTNNIPTDTSFFTLSQINDEDDHYDGGVIFQVDFNIPPSPPAPPLEKSTTNTTVISKKHSDYRVYPNPANNLLNVEMTILSNAYHIIEIMDLTGKVLQKEKFSYKEVGTFARQLDISKIASGTYQVRIRSDTHSEVKKINILR